MDQPQNQVGKYELHNESPPLRHTSHVPTWLNSHLRADWTSARGHFASVFQKRLRSALRICVYTGLVLSLLLLLPHTLLISAFTMDVPEPDQSPFTAMTAHTSKLTRVSSNCRLKGGCDQRNAIPSFPVLCSQGLGCPRKTLC